MIRPAAEHDRPGIDAVVRAAFDDGGEVADLVVDLRTSGAIEVELVAVEREDGEAVVGHVALERGWVDAEEVLLDVLVLSPLSVAPSHQRRGLGTGLIEAALEAARERGESYVFLEGSPDYYGHRGFERAGSRGFLRPSERIPGPAFQVAVLEDSGATGRLVYPDAFWRHDMVGLRGEVLAALRERFGE
jgi:putative acetyltransferase